MLAVIGIVAALLLVRAVADIGHPRSAMSDLILFGPLAAAGLGALALALRNSRLIIDHDSVAHVTLFCRARTWPRTAVSRADRFSTMFQGAVRYVVFVGADERALFTLTSGIWDVDAVVDACRRARIQLTGTFGDLESGFSLNRRIPGITTWRNRTVAFLVVALIVALAIISTLIYGPSSGG